MKEYPTEKIRNVALVGHQGCGKTTLVEALLYNSGATTRIGRIEEGNTVSDWDDDEKTRGISLSTAIIPIEFNDTKINVLDTPGYTDFQGEVKNAIRVADSVIVVVDAVSGVEVGTELAWEYGKVYQQPFIVVINKLDRENADFEATMDSLRATFPEYKFIPVMLPIGQQADFKGVVNLLTMKAYYNEGRDRSDLPPEMADIAREAHLQLVEAAAEADEKLLDKYATEGELSPEEIRDGMRLAARDHLLNTVPVFVTSGAKNIGTIPVLEAFTVYVSPPSQRRVGIMQPGAAEHTYLTAPQSDGGPLAAYVFKTTTDRYVGQLNYFRIFSGSVTSDSRCYNSSKQAEERVGQLLVARGKETMPVPALHAGDIGVIAKLAVTKTTDTLCGKDAPFEILKPTFPDPVYSVAVTPRTQADGAKMGTMLTSLAEADPTLRWRQDADIHQVILEGMGDTHLAVAISRAEHLGVGIDTQMPKVPYRETITKQASATYRHKKQTGGAGQFGEVSLRLEPNPGEGYQFATQVVGGAISNTYFPSIEKGIHSVLGEGVLAGYPVVDVKAVVYDGKMHPVDSKDIAFQIAGREAFKEAFMQASPVLTEPIMDVEITVPESMMGDVLSDLNTRRGRVQGMDTVARRSVVTAQVPLAEMLRYSNDLRSMSGGRGIYRMTFSHYERVPAQYQEQIVKSAQASA